MGRVAVIASAALVLLAGASPARSQTHAFFGGVKIGLRGYGSVQPGKGFDVHTPISCTPDSCKGATARARASHITLVAKPHRGWKLLRWKGACSGKKLKCSIDLSRAPAGAFGDHVRLVHARFSPAARGLTRANPFPLGQAGTVAGSWRLRFNYVTPNGQLSPAAPPGAEYVVANVSVTFLGPGTATLNGLASEAIGNRNVRYHPNPAGPPCPAPYLYTATPYGELPGGESVTGNICWLIFADDEKSLEVPLRFGGPAFFVTDWFALH
jgi:hypothetical protein